MTMVQKVAPQGRTYTFGIGDRIRAAREQASLDQTQLADATGLSRQSRSAATNDVTKFGHVLDAAWSHRLELVT